MREKDSDLLSRFLKDVMAGYDLNPVVASAVRFFLKNPYESAIIVDKDVRIQFMDSVSEAFFGLKEGEAKGKDIRELVPESGLPRTIETGIPMIGRIFEVKGKKRLGAVYPLKLNGEIIGGIGKIMVQSLEEVERINSEIQNLKRELHYLRQKEHNEYGSLYTFEDILGDSKAIIDTVRMAQKVSQLGIDVLITGESGTGKELFAHSIHSYSHHDKPFIKVNCPAIPFELAESELFGYEKGAFTGALTSGKAGSFEMANTGTIFLDEISSLPLSIQAKLLRVLQEKEVARLGTTKTKKIDFRLIAATNVDLRQLVKEGKFRDDLYYRVARGVINLPPVRERKEDIPLYVNHFLEKINRSFKTNIKRISRETMDVFIHYTWSGNIRELINVLEQVAIKASNSEEITLDLLPKEMRSVVERPWKRDSGSGTTSIKQEVVSVEKELIISALREVDGNKRKAATLLTMPRSTLYQKMKKYNIGM
jgi:transcriptional regulator with PAS, ATPase and Fis domain